MIAGGKIVSVYFLIGKIIAQIKTVEAFLYIFWGSPMIYGNESEKAIKSH